MWFSSILLHDLSSSYFKGTTCPLAALGYNRDKKKKHVAGQLRRVTADNGSHFHRW
jgi:hypothetical protein